MADSKCGKKEPRKEGRRDVGYRGDRRRSIRQIGGPVGTGKEESVKPAHSVLEDAHGVSGGTVHPSKSLGRGIRPDGYQTQRDGTESLAELLEYRTGRRGGVDGLGVVQ